MSTQKNNKKPRNRVNPYFVLGLLDNNHALGGPLDGPGDEIKSTTSTPPTPKSEPRYILNPTYEQELRAYNNSLNQFNTSDTYNHNKGKLLPREGNETLYNQGHGDFPNLKVDKVFTSEAGGGAHYFLYQEPKQLLENPNYKKAVIPKTGRYLDPNTGQPLSIEEYGSPGSEDKQLAQGLELESMKLSNKSKQQAIINEQEANKALLAAMTPEQLADAKAKKLTPQNYLASLNMMPQIKAYGGNMMDDSHLGLQESLPIQEYENVNVKQETAKGATKGVISGAATGASMGSVIPGWGTAVGAIVGGIAGGITGGIKSKKQAKSIQDYNMNLYNETEAFRKDSSLPVYALGGPMSVDSISGPRHEENGVAIGKSEVEGGEAKLGNYIFSDRLKPKDSRRTFAQKAKAIELKYKDRDNDAPALRSKQRELESLMAENEMSRKETEYKEQQLQEQLKADAFAYGGNLKIDGNNIVVDSSNKNLFETLAKKRGMSVDEYGKRLFALGGGLPDTSVNPQESEIQRIFELANQNKNYNDGIASQENFITPDVDYDPDLEGIDMSFIDDTDKGSIEDKKFKMGNEEFALLASSLPAVDNFIASMDNSQTKLRKINSTPISLDNQRDIIESQLERGRSAARENVRGNATSSGQALSNMANANAAITQSGMDALSQSFETEANANAQIQNQTNASNAQIQNEEFIMNEQNKDLRRGLQNKSIADITNNTQMYLRDKKLSSENKRQNQRIVDMINSMGYNYKWEDDDGKLALIFNKLLENKND